MIIRATRRRLVTDGYSAMTLAEIAADAGVSRPTIYRRWRNKLELTMDALDYGLRVERDSYPRVDPDNQTGIEAFTEVIRRVDPRYFNADGMVLMGNFIGEADRTPELLAVVCKYGVEPRLALIEESLRRLQQRGEVRSNIDLRIITTMCLGSYYAAFLRGDCDDHIRLADNIAAALWPAISVRAQL